jgi:hypothetical protein
VFTLDENEEKTHEFWWTVTIKKPVDGRYRSHQFQVRFKSLPQDRLDQILEGAAEAVEGDEDGEVEDRIDNALLHEVICGWKDVYIMEGDERKEAPFNTATLDRFLNVTYWRSGVVLEYLKIIGGNADPKKRRRGN